MIPQSKSTANLNESNQSSQLHSDIRQTPSLQGPLQVDLQLSRADNAEPFTNTAVMQHAVAPLGERVSSSSNHPKAILQPSISNPSLINNQMFQLPGYNNMMGGSDQHLAGLSSSNGGVGSLLQHIESSEKSQGDTDQNDFFLDFIANDQKTGVQPTTQLFLKSQPFNDFGQVPNFANAQYASGMTQSFIEMQNIGANQQLQLHQFQQPVFGGGNPSNGLNQVIQTRSKIIQAQQPIKNTDQHLPQPQAPNQHQLAGQLSENSSGKVATASALKEAKLQTGQNSPGVQTRKGGKGKNQRAQAQNAGAQKAKIPKSQSHNNLTLTSQSQLQARAAQNLSQFAPGRVSNQGGTRRKGKAQEKFQNSNNVEMLGQVNLALQSQTSSQNIMGSAANTGNNQMIAEDLTNQSCGSGRSRRGRIPKNKSFSYLDILKKSAGQMVKGDLISLKDADSQVSSRKMQSSRNKIHENDMPSQAKNEIVMETASQHSRGTKNGQISNQRSDVVSIGRVVTKSIVNTDLFIEQMNTNQVPQSKEEKKDVAVSFEQPRQRRSRSKNAQSSSIDTVTGERKRGRPGRRSQSDSQTRLQQRLAKNRISAANSRKRRKKYIEQLEEKVLAAEEQSKEFIRLKTLVEGYKKMQGIQEPIYTGAQANSFFMDRIEDFVKLEEMILKSDENREEPEHEEFSKIIKGLNEQSGPYGIKRKELITNLFKSIMEMAVPGFIEYLFYGYEQREKESGFFSPENLENSTQVDKNMAEDGTLDPLNELSYEQEVLGYDAVTGQEFTRVRKRKPMRYYVPGIVGGCKNSHSIQKYKESIRWLQMSHDQYLSLQKKTETVSQHYQNFKKLFDTLNETREKMLIEMRATDQTVNELIGILTPQQAAKFLLLSDKIKLKQEFDVFTQFETRDRKQHKITPVTDRILTNEEGKLTLQRNHMMSANSSQMSGLGVGGLNQLDREEILEDSSSRVEEAPMEEMSSEEDEEDASEEIEDFIASKTQSAVQVRQVKDTQMKSQGQIKGILKNKSTDSGAVKRAKKDQKAQKLNQNPQKSKQPRASPAQENQKVTGSGAFADENPLQAQKMGNSDFDNNLGLNQAALPPNNYNNGMFRQAISIDQATTNMIFGNTVSQEVQGTYQLASNQVPGLSYSPQIQPQTPGMLGLSDQNHVNATLKQIQESSSASKEDSLQIDMGAEGLDQQPVAASMIGNQNFGTQPQTATMQIQDHNGFSGVPFRFEQPASQKQSLRQGHYQEGRTVPSARQKVFDDDSSDHDAFH